MISEMEKLLAQLDKQREIIINQLQIVKKDENPYNLMAGLNKVTYNESIDSSQYQNYLRYDKQYTLLTFTYAPLVSSKMTFQEQELNLLHHMYKFDLFQYFGCLEKHKSGILHAHILVVIDQAEQLPLLKQIANQLSGMSNSKLMPALKMQYIKRNSEIDLKRTLRYICEDKKDHPIFKIIKINI